MPRFFVKEKLDNVRTVSLTEEHALQLQKVLRKKVGDEVEVFNGTGDFAILKLDRISRESTFGTIISKDFRDDETKVVVFQCLPKNPKTELIVQKCTELNVGKIIFLVSDHSVPKVEEMSQKKLDRLQKIAIEAAEQSHRTSVPEILFETEGLAKTITELTNGYRGINFSNKMYLDIDGSYLNNIKSEKAGFNAVFIGPEGGFSKPEKELFDQNNFTKVRLSQNVLRCETAGIAFLAQYSLV